MTKNQINKLLILLLIIFCPHIWIILLYYRKKSQFWKTINNL